MNHLSATFPDPRGHRLRYQYWEDSSAGYGRVALFLHGLGRHSDGFAPVAPSFAAARYKVYALDFPGFGSSPGPRGEGGVVALADAVEALCRRIESSEGRREIDLVAHSLGAIAALLFLKRYPARNLRLAVASPLLFGVPMAAKDETFSAEEGAASLPLDAALPGAFAAELDETAKSLLSDPAFLEGREAAFFVGEADPLVPLDRLARAVDSLPLRSKKVVSFPRERHDLFAGKKADRVAGSIISWFDEARSARAAP